MRLQTRDQASQSYEVEVKKLQKEKKKCQLTGNPNGVPPNFSQNLYDEAGKKSKRKFPPMWETKIDSPIKVRIFKELALIQGCWCVWTG